MQPPQCRATNHSYSSVTTHLWCSHSVFEVKLGNYILVRKLYDSPQGAASRKACFHMKETRPPTHQSWPVNQMQSADIQHHPPGESAVYSDSFHLNFKFTTIHKITLSLHISIVFCTFLFLVYSLSQLIKNFKFCVCR